MCLMGLDEMLLVQMSVDLSGGNVGMSQQLLNHPEVGPPFEEVSREGMPQQVGIDPFG